MARRQIRLTDPHVCWVIGPVSWFFIATECKQESIGTMWKSSYFSPVFLHALLPWGNKDGRRRKMWNFLDTLAEFDFFGRGCFWYLLNSFLIQYLLVDAGICMVWCTHVHTTSQNSQITPDNKCRSWSCCDMCRRAKSVLWPESPQAKHAPFLSMVILLEWMLYWNQMLRSLRLIYCNNLVALSVYTSLLSTLWLYCIMQYSLARGTALMALDSFEALSSPGLDFATLPLDIIANQINFSTLHWVTSLKINMITANFVAVLFDCRALDVLFVCVRVSPESFDCGLDWAINGSHGLSCAKWEFFFTRILNAEPNVGTLGCLSW